MPSKKKKKGINHYKKRAHKAAEHHVNKIEDLRDHDKISKILKRKIDIDRYHMKRQQKFSERAGHMSHEEKERFDKKTRHKMDHIARHGKDGKHRWDYDDRHQHLTDDQKKKYKEKRKAINAKHKRNGTYGTKEHISDLEGKSKKFHDKHDKKHDGKHGDREGHDEDEEKEKEKIISKWPRRRQLLYRNALRAKDWTGAAAIATAGFAGSTGNLVSTSLKAASGDFSGAVQHAHSAIGAGVSSAEQDFRSRAGGSNAKSDGLSMGKNISGGSDSDASSLSGRSKKGNSYSDSDGDDVSTEEN